MTDDGEAREAEEVEIGVGVGELTTMVLFRGHCSYDIFWSDRGMNPGAGGFIKDEVRRRNEDRSRRTMMILDCTQQDMGVKAGEVCSEIVRSGWGAGDLSHRAFKREWMAQ